MYEEIRVLPMGNRAQAHTRNPDGKGASFYVRSFPGPTWPWHLSNGLRSNQICWRDLSHLFGRAHDPQPPGNAGRSCWREDAFDKGILPLSTPVWRISRVYWENGSERVRAQSSFTGSPEASLSGLEYGLRLHSGNNPIKTPLLDLR